MTMKKNQNIKKLLKKKRKYYEIKNNNKCQN